MKQEDKFQPGDLVKNTRNRDKPYYGIVLKIRPIEERIIYVQWAEPGPSDIVLEWLCFVEKVS